MFLAVTPAAEHLEHPVGDDEAADHVDRAQDDAGQAEPSWSGDSAVAVTMIAPTTITPWTAFAPDINGVEHGRHLAHDLVADERGQDEDEQGVDQGLRVQRLGHGWAPRLQRPGRRRSPRGRPCRRG